MSSTYERSRKEERRPIIPHAIKFLLFAAILGGGTKAAKSTEHTEKAPEHHQIYKAPDLNEAYDRVVIGPDFKDLDAIVKAARAKTEKLDPVSIKEMLEQEDVALQEAAGIENPKADDTPPVGTAFELPQSWGVGEPVNPTAKTLLQFKNSQTF